MANMQVQEASGLKSGFLAGYGADTPARHQSSGLGVACPVLHRRRDILPTAKWRRCIRRSARLPMSSPSFAPRSAAASTGSSTGDASAISTSQQLLQQMGGMLNTQYDGQYVFGGARTSSAAVDLSTFATGTGSLTTADTSYYQGDSELASVRVSDGQTVSYGVTADNPAFEQVMRALKYVANSTTLSSSDIASVLSVANSAVDAVATVQAKLSNSASQIEGASSLQSISRAMRKSSRHQPHQRRRRCGDRATVDLSGAAHGVLLRAIAKIQSLNLANYLR